MTSDTAIWIDTDMGVDDLHAILAIAAHRPVAGVSVGHGCAALPRVIENAIGAADHFNWTFPLVAGAARPMLGAVETAEHILGPRGMPTRGRRLATGKSGLPPALPALAAWMETGGPILALGPLTNLATVMLAYDIPPPAIVWMGGSLGRGNHTAHAEFNAFCDPLALAILLDRGADLTMIDLEACRRVHLTEADLAGVSDPLMADLLGGYLDIGLTRGRDHMAIYDPVAAAAACATDLFSFRTAGCVLTGQTVKRAGQRGKTRTGGRCALSPIWMQMRRGRGASPRSERTGHEPDRP